MTEFIVKGDPVPKARARTVRGHSYTPKRTQEAQNRVLIAFREQCKDWTMTDGCLGIEFEFVFQIPKSRKIKEGEFCPKYTDVDNLMKLVMDALNNAAYKDDRQVVATVARKIYGKEGYTKVTLWEI